MIKRTHHKGAAMMIFILFFVFAASALTFVMARSIFSDYAGLAHLGTSKQAYLVAESLAEDVAFRNIWVFTDVDDVEQLAFAHATATATSTLDTFNDVLVIDSKANLQERVRTAQLELTIGAGTAFNYGLQAGNGGITLANSAGVVGNVYSNGTVLGGGSSLITGDVVSAGPSGRIDSIHATGTARANTLSDSLVEGDAHYNVVDVPSVVNGTRYTPSPNQPTTSLPIAEETIEEWKQAILDYGTTIASTSAECSGGTYTIDFTTTIGYLKVECDLDIKETGGDIFITMDGPVWVEGNISFTQQPDILIDPSLGRFSTQFIADNESDRLTSSQIEIRNSTTFTGTGHESSVILLLSRNESASLGGGEVAINVSQSADGDVMVYSNAGLIDIGNGIFLKEVTAYQINVAQNSDIVYESGLANINFTSGPGGGYVLSDWTESY